MAWKIPVRPGSVTAVQADSALYRKEIDFREGYPANQPLHKETKYLAICQVLKLARLLVIRDLSAYVRICRNMP